MANTLVLEDRRSQPWGKVDARVFWEGGGQDGVWVNESGRGEFPGSGTILYIKVASEEITPTPRKVDGRTTIIAVSRNTH
jgi:hypothetical protein